MRKKPVAAIILILILGLGGYLLVRDGGDAVTLATKEKKGILTADQINVSFQQVGGRVIDVNTQEGKRVKKGDILMVLDSTDIDLQLAKLQAEIAAMDVRITQAEQTLGNEDIERQRLEIEKAAESFKNTKASYDRTKELYDNEAVSKSNLESAETQLVIAENKLSQERELLSQVQKATANKVIGVDLLQKQKEGLITQLKALEVQKERLILKAPENGKIVRVIPKNGENVAPGAPVMLLETDQLYFDIYVAETQVTGLQVGHQLAVHILSTNKDVKGKVHSVIAAPQFAGLRNTAEKGTVDLNSFQVRVYIDQSDLIIPGMTVEVNVNEIIKG